MKNKILSLALLVASAFYSSNAMSQADTKSKDWIIVPKHEFERYNIQEDLIQFVDVRENEKDLGYTDNSKLGKRFIDREGAIYYWVNLHPASESNIVYDSKKVVNPQVTEKDLNKVNNEKTLNEAQILEKIVSDPEIKRLIGGFNSSFKVIYPYAYLGEDVRDASGYLRKKGKRVIIPGEIKKRHPRGNILQNKDSGKSVLIPHCSFFGNYNLKRFLGEYKLFNDIGYAIKKTISCKGNLKTLEEKKAFIIPYFTDSIPNAMEKYAEYNPPIIYQDEWIFTYQKGKEKKIQYKNNIKLDDAKPAKPVIMNEQKLDEILRE